MAFSKSNIKVSTWPWLSICSSRRGIMFEHTMCSSNLQGTQVKETGQ